MNFHKFKLKEFDFKSAVKTFDYRKCRIELTFAISIVLMLIVLLFSSHIYATEEYWQVSIGDKVVATLNSEDSANSVISQVKDHYTKSGATDVSATIDPEITVTQKFYRTIAKAPDVSTVDEVVDYILTGNKVEKTYTVKKGDTFWGIAEKKDISLSKLLSINNKKEESKLVAGDKLTLEAVEPMVTVTTTQTVKENQKIKYKTIYKKSSKLVKNTKKVKKVGKYGKKLVTATVTTVNGKTVKTSVISSKVVKKPTAAIVLKGTKKSSSKSGTSSSTGGQAVANYALQFVGIPYVWGGSSLTSGVDCSGFVMAVYAHFGVSLPHDAGADRNYGKGVSVSNARPGDLICYYGHIGIYIGGGRLVHAKDYGYGVCIDNIHYSSKPILTVRRIFN